MKQATWLHKTRTLVSLASAALLFSAGPIAAQVSAPGNGKALPDSAQKAPPFQGGGSGGGVNPPGGDYNALLTGIYIYSGPAACLFSQSGFNANLQPLGFAFVQTYTVNGTLTFNGDGTGSVDATSVSVNQFAAGSVTFQVNFTYQVNPDLTITINDLASTATNVQTGEISSITESAPLEGRVSEDLRTIHVMHYVPKAEKITNLTTNTIGYRICARERTFTRFKSQ